MTSQAWDGIAPPAVRSRYRSLKIGLFVVTLTVVCFTLGNLIYHAGRLAAVRECPAVQQGERLILSEQGKNGTICTYAGGWNSYGKTTRKRHAAAKTQQLKLTSR